MNFPICELASPKLDCKLVFSILEEEASGEHQQAHRQLESRASSGLQFKYSNI